MGLRLMINMLSRGFVVRNEEKLNAKSEVKKFFAAFKKSPQSSLYILCNLLLKIESKDLPQANQAIDSIQKDIVPAQINMLIETMINIELTKGRLLSHDRAKSFWVLKTSFMTQLRWHEVIELESVYKLCKSDEFILMGLIALTRIYIIRNTDKDLFNDFDFNILKGFGTKQIISSIREKVKLCETLPLDYFKRLGKNDIKHARIIISFLQEHPTRFEMGEYFITCHPELKQELYINWKQTKESSVLPEKEKETLNKTIHSVSGKHPEFRVILNSNRIPRDIPDDSNIEYDYGYIGNILGHVKDIEWCDVATRGGAAVVIGTIEIFSPSSIIPLPVTSCVTSLGYLGKWFIWAATTPVREVKEPSSSIVNQSMYTRQIL